VLIVSIFTEWLSSTRVSLANKAEIACSS